MPTPEDVRRLCVDDHHFEIIQTLGARSGLAVPLVAREALFGALSLVSATPNRFVEADVELVVEIGRRTALAIDNARLLVETQRAVHLRDQFLSTASHELRTPITSLKLIVESLIHGTAISAAAARGVRGPPPARPAQHQPAGAPGQRAARRDAHRAGAGDPLARRDGPRGAGPRGGATLRVRSGPGRLPLVGRLPEPRRRMRGMRAGWSRW